MEEGKIMKHPLFNGGIGQYNGVPEDQVKAISNKASLILSDAMLVMMTTGQIDEMKKSKQWVELPIRFQAERKS